MVNLDEDALICDLAETYQIYDYRSLPLQTVATLSAGLRDDSRIKLKMADIPVGIDTFLLAVIADRIEAFRYGFSEDSTKKRNVPDSLVDILRGKEPKREKNKVVAFRSVDELNAALKLFEGE